MKLPTAAQLIASHDRFLARWGGETGWSDAIHGPGAIDSAVFSTAMAVDAEKLTAFEAAALLGAYLLTSHTFLDGNKRATAAAIVATLEANGITLTAEPRELFERLVHAQRATEFSWDQLGRALSPREIVAELAPWLARNSRPARKRR